MFDFKSINHKHDYERSKGNKSAPKAQILFNKINIFTLKGIPKRRLFLFCIFYVKSDL